MLYIDGELEQTQIYIQDQSEMYWATLTLSYIFVYFKQIFIWRSKECFIFISKSNMYIYIYSTFKLRMILHWGCMKPLGVFFTIISLPFIWNTSIEVNLKKCKPARETCINAVAACLPVCPAVSLRWKTCVLWRSDSLSDGSCLRIK